LSNQGLSTSWQTNHYHADLSVFHLDTDAVSRLAWARHVDETHDRELSDEREVGKEELKGSGGGEREKKV
jgi:hypothetical protein